MAGQAAQPAGVGSLHESSVSGGGGGERVRRRWTAVSHGAEEVLVVSPGQVFLSEGAEWTKSCCCCCCCCCCCATIELLRRAPAFAPRDPGFCVTEVRQATPVSISELKPAGSWQGDGLIIDWGKHAVTAPVGSKQLGTLADSDRPADISPVFFAGWAGT